MTTGQAWILLPVGELPGTIRESIRCALVANGHGFHDRDGNRLTDEDVEGFLNVLGRHVAQSLRSLDQGPVSRPRER